MSGLLPTKSSATIERSEDPTLLCLEDERTDEVLSTLSSERSRAVFRMLTEEPLTATEVARELDASVQGVTYHLDNLEETGLIDVLDTCYSEKGREMAVYGAAEEPYLVFLGSADDRPGLTAAFKRFATALGPVGIGFSIAGALSRLVGDE